MPSTIRYSFGDVVLVGFPFTNLEAVKKRPAVVVNSSAYQSRPDVILMAITSRLHEPEGVGESMLSDWKVAGLVKPSMFKPLIATLEKRQIVKVLGRLSEGDRERLKAILQNLIGDS